jgi:hypothetical protein
MQNFRPGMRFSLGQSTFEWVPHPLFPENSETAYFIEGAQAFLYQIREIATQTRYALKIFKAPARSAHLACVSGYLAARRDLPGLGARLCITRSDYPSLVNALPELEYAVLMPWYEGPTWSDVVYNPDLSARYSLADARELALATADVFWHLEIHGLAHSDLAGSNLLIAQEWREIRLLDVENMYVPGLPAPAHLSYGSPGYQHRSPAPHGYWCAEGDRFAGAVLLAEILTWWDPAVRALAPAGADTLFQPEEVQMTGTPLWHAVRNTLFSLHADLLTLFDRAWASKTPAACPELAAWAAALRIAFCTCRDQSDNGA